MELLKGKVAIVTGSSDGIGAEIALEFVRQGASVTLHGRNIEKLESVGEKCQALSKDKKKPLTIVGDVCNSDIRVQLINDTVRHYGKLDIIVSNAGYFTGKPLTADCDITSLDLMLNVHARVPYHLLKLSAKHLIKSKGNFINISSVAGKVVTMETGIDYAAGKAAADHIIKFAALELGPQGVRVNTISPGFIKTNAIKNSAEAPSNSVLQDEKMSKEMSKDHSGMVPLKRVGIVEDVANLAAFLASDKASYISGADYIIDGGLVNVGALCSIGKTQC